MIVVLAALKAGTQVVLGESKPPVALLSVVVSVPSREVTGVSSRRCRPVHPGLITVGCDGLKELSGRVYDLHFEDREPLPVLQGLSPDDRLTEMNPRSGRAILKVQYKRS